jgi:putative ABC transport system permease protein
VLSLRLTLRALAWRAAASLTVFAVALIAITAAAVGPIYLHAVDEAVLAHRLTYAAQGQLDLRIAQDTTIGVTDVEWHHAVSALAAQASDPHWFDPPVFSENAPVEWTGKQTYDTDLAAVDDLCDHVKVVAGRCLTESDDASTVITQRTAQRQDVTVGEVINPVPGGNSAKLPVQVVGIVAPISAHGAFWSPWPYFDAADSLFGNKPPRLDAFFVSHHFLDSHENDVPQTVSANLRLRADNVRLDDLAPLRSRLVTLQTAAAHTDAVSAVSIPVVHSGLPGVLDAMWAEMSLARTLVILPAAQLVVLAIVLLYAVVAGTAAAGGHEVALAKLRGRRTSSVLTQGLAQPVVLVLVAAPIAAAIAWGIVRLVAGDLLGAGVGVAFPAAAVDAAATAASVVAAIVAARQILVSPVGQLLRRTESASSRQLGLVLVDAATVALGVAGVVELAATGTLDSGTANPLSAVATIMLGAAIAVVVVRLLPLTGRAVVRWTTESSRVAAFLAVRQIVRRPLGARVIVLLGVALSLATFAVIMWSTAASNRQQRALEQAGANTVLMVRTKPDVYDLRTAVDRADPSGHSMAAAIVKVARTTPLLAVDTARFARVAAWAPRNAPDDLGSVLSRLRSSVAPSISVSHAAVRLDVTANTVPSGATVALSITLTGADHLDDVYTFGPVHQGDNSFVKQVGCAQPCRVTGLLLRAKAAAKEHLPNGASIDATITASVASSSTATSWQRLSGFGDPARWRSNGDGVLRLRASGGGLEINSQQTTPGAGWPTLLSADTPAHLPAVIAKVTASLYNATTIHDVAAFGLDSSPIDLDGSTTALSLPTLDRSGAMVDFGTALNAMRGQFTPQTQLAVYVAHSAPADLVARLAREGVIVTRTVRAATYSAALDRTGPALAEGLFLVAAILATALAIGASVLASATTARRRAYELAALEAAGVPARTLRSSLALEQGVLLVIGLAVGVAAGLIGARLALPNTPVFVNQHIGPPIDAGVPYGLTAALAGILVAVFAVISLVIARLIARQATADRLREVEA